MVHLPDTELAIRGEAGELLGLCDEFFHQADPTVHAELRRFLTGIGHHPVTGLGAFLIRLNDVTLDADTGRPRHHETVRAAELTRLLAEASVLPPGAETRDVGIYRALEVMVRMPGEYWATTDVLDDEGSGHLEVTIAGGARRSPATLDRMVQPDYPNTTGEEQRLPDGSTITTVTMAQPRPDGVVSQLAILARPDGTFLEVRSTNQDARTGGHRTRPTPPVDARDVLDKLFDVRP